MPIMNHKTVQMAHGSGGKMMAELIDKIFLNCFDNPILNKMEDQALLPSGNGELVFTTDSFVVDPLFFPGGNIGDLAVHGTVNDLCMSGAKPAYLSAAFIIEEGFPMEDLHRVASSMKQAADRANVQIVTGDTKVVNTGSCDKLFINTSGIGFLPAGIDISASNVKPGDCLILSGTLADHGMAIMTQRESFRFQSDLLSDSAALNGLVDAMLGVTSDIHAMRDPTRGGLAATLNEFASASGVHIQLDEAAIPVKPHVRAVCEILGIDPLHVANEGKLVAAVPGEKAAKVLKAMKKHPKGKDAAIIGRACSSSDAIVTAQTLLGTERVIDLPAGEILPRIC
ncbi:MAG: hydrogenase expression/formation protein HypE [Acidobacteria bacterium]|nr:MAG: hydrogenase expression/formation protein HypE [Acidobacteriota bacterium]PIE90879.1 MAG: hydrogenase expression/formation protein HypE [Acidobacteriota bacterium]